MKITLQRAFQKQEPARVQWSEDLRTMYYKELDMLKEVHRSSGRIYIQKTDREVVKLGVK